MQTEARHISPIEQELLFRKWLDKRQINRILLDLDDTICATRKVFRYFLDQTYDLLAYSAPILDREGWKQVVADTESRMFEKYGVIPERLSYGIDEIGKTYSLAAEIQDRAKGILSQIFTTPVEMLPGAEKRLKFLKKSDRPIGVVTHNDPLVAWKKYNWLKLNRYIDWDEVFLVAPRGHKTAESWKEGSDYFRTTLERCLIGGDSPRTDINAAMAGGARHCILVRDPLQWSVHQQPVDPSVYIVDNLAQIAELGREELY